MLLCAFKVIVYYHCLPKIQKICPMIDVVVKNCVGHVRKYVGHGLRMDGYMYVQLLWKICFVVCKQ